MEMGYWSGLFGGLGLSVGGLVIVSFTLCLLAAGAGLLNHAVLPWLTERLPESEPECAGEKIDERHREIIGLAVAKAGRGKLRVTGIQKRSRKEPLQKSGA